MQLISKSLVSIALIILLLLVNPKIAIVVGLILLFAYGAIYNFTRKYLFRIGKEREKNNHLRFTAISEAFGAAKEVKVGGLEKIYVERFSDPAKSFAKTQASAAITSQLPRFILEAIIFGGIMILLIYLVIKTGSFNTALPTISLYVVAGYRLIPALQEVYASFTQLAFVGPALDKLHDDISSLKPINSNQDPGILHLNKLISLKNICYNYPNTSRTALKNINIDINSKTTVGLVGSTGSGKTTTVDIILGLLEAQEGMLEVDGTTITKQNARSWQKSIGYVPQHIYLSDDTVAANIAFGVKSDLINYKAIEKASKIANLHEFVVNELPNQYQTKIGERGVRLSGGQRQRIGIARALYHNPQVLILDEATSALDNFTEKVVMDAVNNLNKNITIILIAHRLNTVKKCDKIYFLEQGEVKNQGKFEELIDNNENFKTTTNN